MITPLFVLLTLTAQGAMKCEAGKCTSGKTVTAKPLPKAQQTANSKPQTDTTKQPNEKAVAARTVTTEKKTHKGHRPVIEQLFNVRTVKVKQMKAAKAQVNYGYIVAEDQRRVDVSAWFGGFVETLYADKRFIKVNKGDALAKVYSPEVYKAKQDYLNSIRYNAKRSAPGMLRGAKEKLVLLNVSPKEIAQIEKERRADAYTTIYAPVSGWIFGKHLNSGSSFKRGQTLFEIVNIDEVWMEAKLFQNDLAKLDKLDRFTLKVKGISGSFEAQKSLLYPKLDPKEATATLRLVVTNPDERLKPGMYAKVYASSKAKTKLVIPRTAAIRKEGMWYAFLATDFKGEYEPVHIEVEPLDSQYFIVKKGLHEGEEIVNNALFMMDSDAQINSIY